jgi:P-type E1-E2 ATPase
MQCRVLRNGKVETIHHNFLHVGDVINIEYGMANPVDGIVFQAASLTCDEAAMTGESDEMKKETQYFCKLRRDEKNAENPKGDEHNKMHRAHEISSPLILSGTSIAGGEGKMVCLMVGADSCIGQIISKLIVAPEVTPLQSKLE